MTYEPKHDALLEDSTPAVCAQHGAPPLDDTDTQSDTHRLFSSAEAQEALRCLPRDYQLRHDGLHALVETTKDTFQWNWISAPLVVVGSARAAGSTGWSVMIEFTDPEGVVRRDILSRKQLIRSGKTAL